MRYSLDDPPSLRVVPVRALLLTLLASLGLSWWLVPTKEELLQRVFLDKHQWNFRDALSAQFASATGMDDLDLTELTASQLNFISALMRLTPREQLQTIFISKRQLTYDKYMHAVAMAAVRYVDVIQPQQAWDIIQRGSDRLKGEQIMDLAILLAHNSLAVSKPDLAATILEQAAEQPVSGPNVARELAQACRWSGRPLIGAERVQSWLERHQSTASQADFDELSELASVLALEGGNPALALKVTLGRLQKLGAEAPIPEQLITQLLDCANQCSQTASARVWLARYVAQMPESALSWQQLREKKQKEPTSLANYTRYVALLANYSDWSSEFDSAFDAHFRLAAMGSLPDLDRCMALRIYLGRDEDLAPLLVAMGSVPERPAFQLELASMLAALGDDVGARPVFEAWVAAHPQDQKAAYDLACLVEDMGQEDTALKLFQQQVKNFPKDVKAVKKLAEGFIRRHQLAEALALYAQLPAAEHDYMTRENYALLAESLDQPDQLLKAQLLTAHAQEIPKAEVYLEMAETGMYLAEPQDAIAGVEEGLELLPDSPGLRSGLAQLYLRKDSGVDGDSFLEKAAALIMHPTTLGSAEAVGELLVMAPRLTDKERALQFLGPDIEQKLSLPAEDRLRLAVLCHLCSQPERGDRLFASVPRDATHIHALAEARFQIGHYQNAVDLMTSYLDNNPKANSDDWVFLGDVYDEMGYAQQAQQAYEYSLQLLTSDLTGKPTGSVSSVLLPAGKTTAVSKLSQVNPPPTELP
jgi:tetratricopeptide (TPR) repeat protein